MAGSLQGVIGSARPAGPAVLSLNTLYLYLNVPASPFAMTGGSITVVADGRQLPLFW